MKRKRRHPDKAVPTPSRRGKSRRNVLVLLGLLGSLTLTSVVLLALAPNPLAPGPARSLLAVTEEELSDGVFQTRIPLEAGRWQSIFVHHTRTRRGNSSSLGQRTGGLGDHFLIGNGDGTEDGQLEISQRWTSQQPATVSGAQLPERCISIALVGDYDLKPPTARQMRQLEQLVRSLQRRCAISPGSVLTSSTAKSPVGIGKQFPLGEFRKRLQP